MFTHTTPRVTRKNLKVTPLFLQWLEALHPLQVQEILEGQREVSELLGYHHQGHRPTDMVRYYPTQSCTHPCARTRLQGDQKGLPSLLTSCVNPVSVGLKTLSENNEEIEKKRMFSERDDAVDAAFEKGYEAWERRGYNNWRYTWCCEQNAKLPNKRIATRSIKATPLF